MPPVFSKDGKSVAYARRKAGRDFVILNGKVVGEYDSVYTPLFDPGEHRSSGTESDDLYPRLE